MRIKFGEHRLTTAGDQVEITDAYVGPILKNGDFEVGICQRDRGFEITSDSGTVTVSPQGISMTNHVEPEKEEASENIEVFWDDEPSGDYFPGKPESWAPEIYAHEDTRSRIREAVFQALGSASVCWENPSGAGKFDPERARKIGDGLLSYLFDKEGI